MIEVRGAKPRAGTAFLACAMGQSTIQALCEPAGKP
jgi:hypothetical protein